MRTAFDYAMAFARVIATSVNDRTSATEYNLTGIAPLDPDDEIGDEDAGETDDGAEEFGAIGLLARPPDPEVIGGKDFAADVVCARTSDGLVPIAWRDLRLYQFFPNGVPKGRVALVGYGGGFHTLDPQPSGDRDANIHVIYCPYDYVGGVAQKASSIIIDPDPANGITVTHGMGATEGYQIVANDEGIQLRGPGSETFFWMNENTIEMGAKTAIRMKANVLIGSADAGHLPLVAGALSPPCPSLWLSPA